MTITEPALLHLLQLVSPALPVGAFSYSEGLEVLQQSGQLGDATALQQWLKAELQRGAVAIEAAALDELCQQIRAWRNGDATAAAAVLDLDRWLQVQREAPEVRAQQRQMGGSLLALLADLRGPLLPAAQPLPPLSWPAAFAWAGVCLAIGPSQLELAYLYGWVSNQISAAVRLIPLGPTEGQRLQLRLAPLIDQRARQLAAADPRSLWTSGVGAGLAQLQHAELYSRLFRS
ncbi:MAG: urease accessory protein UreF [Cyanobacteria bacterium K_DeepCast_35m_m2_023]|nr:urease accessory protein UreF [Cyanobacteria bacterium K_DeepCast_35m_m2_023]